jgi:hypothetical protein
MKALVLALIKELAYLYHVSALPASVGANASAYSMQLATDTRPLFRHIALEPFPCAEEYVVL